MQKNQLIFSKDQSNFMLVIYVLIIINNNLIKNW